MRHVLDLTRPLDERGEGYMPKFVIERDMPGAGNLSKADLHGAAQKSCDVLRGMGPETFRTPAVRMGCTAPFDAVQQGKSLPNQEPAKPATG